MPHHQQPIMDKLENGAGWLQLTTKQFYINVEYSITEI